MDKSQVRSYLFPSSCCKRRGQWDSYHGALSGICSSNFSPYPSPPDDCRQFQELLRKIADTLWIPLEEVHDTPHKPFYILQSMGSSKVSVPIKEVFMEWATVVWHTLCYQCPSSEKKYFVPANFHTLLLIL